MVCNIAESDGLGRTSLLAGRQHLSISQIAVLNFSLLSSRVDALNAVHAFLHHTAPAHRNIRIENQLLYLIGPTEEVVIEVIIVVEEVKSAHLIGAVVGAIAGSNAAVIDHLVDTLYAMLRRPYRAHIFARRLFTLHARYRLEVDAWVVCKRLEIVGLRLVVGIHPNPVHMPPPHNLRFSNHGNVVLRLTGHHADAATNARLEVNDHTPVVSAFVTHSRLRPRKSRIVIGLPFAGSLCSVRLFGVLIRG